MMTPRANPVLPSSAFVICILFYTVASLLMWFRGPNSCNNFAIFVHSFEHLASHQNLYAIYEGQHQDIFKYSPTFALCIFPFGVVPRLVGLILWNLVNVITFWAGVQGLMATRSQKAFIMAICFLPLLGALQNAQSNGLVAGSMLLAYNAMESKKPLHTALFICCGAFTKLFTVAMAPCFILYGQSFRYLRSLVVIAILMFLAPLPLVGMESLIEQYCHWLQQLMHDQSGKLNFSLFSLLERVTGIDCPRLPLVAGGALLLVSPLLRPPKYRTPAFRAMFLSSVLIWVVIFNNKAESPTYIIAACGAAIWCIQQRPTSWLILFMSCYVVLTQLAFTDIMPAFIQDEILMRYALKALPSTLLWCYIQWQLLTSREILTTN